MIFLLPPSYAKDIDMNTERANNDNRELLQMLVECAMTCEACATACLNEEDVSMMARCIELDRDCADTCFVSSRLLLRNSEISNSMLAVCEEICRMCAEECKK